MIQLVIILLLTVSMTAFSQTEMKGFRGFDWDTPRSSMWADLVPDSGLNPGFKAYNRPNDDLIFEGFQTLSIIYGFKKDLFTGVILSFHKDDYPALLKMITERYGEPSKKSETPFLNNYVWKLSFSEIAIINTPLNESEKNTTLNIGKLTRY
ncbi:MAG TPA: hypothetical protein PLK12_01030 [Prolixibacteraceae bacterium]|nr:hypothetical protein [Prolixibacteraceae bacterium]